ncbi:MAG: glycyl-radical enzyme activating protein, partial [Victivallales bacterium]|nr:glycyl-radical enzyme activating protein [Victivallales bacterium]
MYFDVKRFSVSDGPGIRTVLFLKGCPLRCLWCHNPESQDFRKDILFDPLKCIACGACAKVCPYDCHHLKNGVHIFDRDACRRCGECAENCFFGALENVGYEATPDKIMAEVIADKPFYGKNGGLTVSGGEPMSQFDVTKRLFEIARENSISTALDTSGWTEWKLFEEIFPLTDYFLYDLKAVDREKHKLLTGVDNTQILHNLLLLGKLGGKIHLRCPLIPGLNDSLDDLRLIAQTADRCRNILDISL